LHKGGNGPTGLELISEESVIERKEKVKKEGEMRDKIKRTWLRFSEFGVFCSFGTKALRKPFREALDERLCKVFVQKEFPEEDSTEKCQGFKPDHAPHKDVCE